MKVTAKKKDLLHRLPFVQVDTGNIKFEKSFFGWSNGAESEARYLKSLCKKYPDQVEKYCGLNGYKTL